MKASALTALLLAASLASSCIVVAAGVGAAATYGYISYQNNVSSRGFEARAELTWKAVLHAMKAQDYPVQGDPMLGPVDGIIRSGDTEILVQHVAGGTSRVRVTIGTFESDQNERMAKLLLQEIARRLGES